MTGKPTRLKYLLQSRHVQTYGAFTREYDKIAESIDRDLVGKGPSRAQFERWKAGGLKTRPYPNQCRVLEAMFPGWTADQLFERFSSEKEALKREDEAVSTEPERPAQVSPTPSGQVVELELLIDIDIDQEGRAHVTYHHELQNLTSRPLARITRELWFERTAGPIRLTAMENGGRHVAIKRVTTDDDTGNVAKFAIQVSPPIQSGESGVIRYECDGGLFREDHYWREAIRRPTRLLAIKLRHREAGRLVTCSAIEEHPDGFENSANDELLWSYDSDDLLVSPTRRDLQPGQTVTVHWEVSHEPAR